MYDEHVSDGKPLCIQEGYAHIRIRIHGSECFLFGEPILDIRGEVLRLSGPEHPFAHSAFQIVLEDRGNVSLRPVRECPHALAPAIDAFRHQGILDAERGAQRTHDPREEILLPQQGNLFLHHAHDLTGSAARRNVAGKNDDLSGPARVVIDDAPLGLDEPDIPVAIDEPVFKALSHTRGDSLFERLPDPLPVFGMDIQEGTRPFQRLRLFQKRLVGGAVVEALPVQIRHGDIVAQRFNYLSEEFVLS